MKTIAFFLAGLGLVVLTGCTSTPQDFYTFQQTEFKLTVIPNTENFSLPKRKGVTTYGEAVIGHGYCVIRLKNYPRCLLHEIRHCIEGDFHKHDEINNDDC